MGKFDTCLFFIKNVCCKNTTVQKIKMVYNLIVWQWRFIADAMGMDLMLLTTIQVTHLTYII